MQTLTERRIAYMKKSETVPEAVEEIKAEPVDDPGEAEPVKKTKKTKKVKEGE